MKKTKNDVTGIVHGLSGRKIGALEFLETICGAETGLLWTKAHDEDITCTKCRSMLHGKYPKNCCEKMDYYLDLKCDQHDNPFECSDTVIYYNKKQNKYGIVIHDGGHSYYEIFFCPWCGTKL